MIYALTGKVAGVRENFVIVEIGGVSFKVFTDINTLRNLSVSGESSVKFFCFLYVRENALELYGFLEEEKMRLFEMLNNVQGIGPKTALAVLAIDKVHNIMAAILERRVDFLARASGIGQKTAERVILELHNKIKLPSAKVLTEVMDVNFETEEALVGLGYPRHEVKKILNEIDPKIKKLEDRLLQALKILGRKK